MYRTNATALSMRLAQVGGGLKAALRRMIDVIANFRPEHERIP